MESRLLPRLEMLSPAWTEYELIDTGGGRKLEKFGAVTLVRPEAQADWRPALAKTEWEAAQAEYVPVRGSKKDEGEWKQGKWRVEKDEREGRRGKGKGGKREGRFVQSGRAERGEWKFSPGALKRWEMRRGRLAFWVETTPAGHVGVFPDQAAHWDWMSALIEAAVGAPRILSLFGYTGLATLACAAAGAQVTHVDASRKAIAWAKENQALSRLEDRPIRWLVDDAPTFVAREIRRGRTYDGLILDPPRFGRGPKGELWKVEEALPALLQQCSKILSPAPLFVLLNPYTTVLTRGETTKEAGQLSSFLQEMLTETAGVNITSGELVLRDRAGRQISNSVFARATAQGR
jgi:23S rRNA (cytosine1962-C5)-methyltransferase